MVSKGNLKGMRVDENLASLQRAVFLEQKAHILDVDMKKEGP